MQRRWVVAEPTDPSLLGDLPYIIGHLLWRRGIRDADEARRFLDVSDSLFEDPGSLPDIDRAAERLASARRNEEVVVVYGDFDADGVTGTALLIRALHRYGLRAVHYIPHRVSEGHGLNLDAVTKIHEQGANLIVTVDCGVTNIAEVDYAHSLGIDTIITDHHVVTDELPRSVAVINPRAPHSKYAFDHLTGVGMALKLAQAVLQPVFGDEWSEGLMELAAIGTITDMAPLFGENRYIVHYGIRELRRTRSIGLRAMMNAARVDPQTATAETIGFTIGPRINAAGRLHRADFALDMLLTDDDARAGELVQELNEYNVKRQALTLETLERVRELVPTPIPPLILVGEPDLNPGVVGLAAGKVVQEFGAPAAVYGMDGDEVMASCRSDPPFHWAEALAQCDDLLIRYGGHAQAAGFRCRAELLPVLRERLTSIAAERLGEATPGKVGIADLEIQPHELMGSTFQSLQRMEPWGVGNPAPVFLARNVQVVKASPMGADGRHFKLSVRSGGALWDVVAFGQSWHDGTQFADIVYKLELDHWNGESRLRLNLQDYAPSCQPRLNL